jgi:hypothetical protein
MDLRTSRTIRSAIEIRAPISVVWHELTDFGAYPAWNPIVRELRGRPREGGRILIRSQPLGRLPVVLRPRVLAWAPPHEMRWRSSFVWQRLFSGEHGFRLEPLDDGRVRFVQDETFRGLLVPLYSRFRLPRARHGFEQMNRLLRERSEAAAARLAEGGGGS